MATAMALFLTRGYDRTALREIATSMSLSKSGLYHHFGAKEDLLGALLEPLLDKVDALLADTPPTLTTASEQETFLTAYVQTLLDHRQAVALLFRDSAVRTVPLIAKRLTHVNDQLHARLARSDDRLSALARAAYVLSGLQGLIVNLTEHPPDQVRDAGVNLAMASLARGRSRTR